MLTIAPPVSMLATVDEHKHVAAHVRQLEDLRTRIVESRTRVSGLTAERDQLQRAEHEAGVAAALGDAVAPQPANGKRLARLDDEIARAKADLAAVEDASARLQVIARGARVIVEREIAEQAAAFVRMRVEEMRPLVRQLLALNREAYAVAQRHPGVRVPPFPLLEAFEQALGAE